MRFHFDPVTCDMSNSKQPIFNFLLVYGIENGNGNGMENDHDRDQIFGLDCPIPTDYRLIRGQILVGVVLHRPKC